MLKKTVENGDMVTLKQAFSKGVYLISLKREGSRPETRKLIIK
jgi:hypothetical protein